MNVKVCAVGGAIVALVAIVAAVSVLPSGHNQAAAQRPVLVPAANVALASSSSEDIRIEAVEGTLSVFWGDVTRYANHIWVMENEDGRFVVEEVNDTLIVYNADEEVEAIAEAVVGSVRAFMAVLVAAATCLGCTTLECCGQHCETESCAWWVCVAKNTCGAAGVQYVDCANGGFGCYPPSQQ